MPSSDRTRASPDKAAASPPGSSCHLEVEHLPYVDFQHDALSVFDDVEQSVVLREDIWISGYKAGSSSVHGKARVEVQEGGGVGVKGREGVEVERVMQGNFLVSVPSLSIDRSPVKFPKQVIHPGYMKAKPTSAPLHINSLDYSPVSGQLVIGGPDGYCAVIPTNASATNGGSLAVQDVSSPRAPPTEARKPGEELALKGHVGDVLSCRWFPSGEVVLTSSSDLSLRIFSSKTGVNPRTLKGHTRAVTCTHILGVGKEVLSGSKDGTIRLWNVGEGKEVRKWDVEGRRAVEDMAVLDNTRSLDEMGLGGEERAIIAGTKEGLVVLPWSGRGVRSIPNAEGTGAFVSMAVSVELGLVATGHSDGTIHLRNLATLRPVTTEPGSSTTPAEKSREKLIRRNESSMYSLKFDGTDLLVGTATGLPCRLTVSSTPDGIHMKTKEEYAGWEAVGVECWAVGENGSVWCAGGEGGIRRY